MKGFCFILLIILINVFCSVLGELQPVDVDPVIKKEQPDFEDDTGPASLQSGKVEKVVVDTVTTKPETVNTSLTHAFVASLSIIIVSELGDKTFFIAAIMAMNHPRLTVFAGAMTSLAIMHVMAALFGHIITIIPRMYSFYLSTALFAIFGIQMLREGLKMSPDVAREEFEEVQSDIRHREENQHREGLEEGPTRRKSIRTRIIFMLSQVFCEALTLTFFAEWGDRSQLATVVLAARENVYGIILGGLLGHFLCTGLAVIGGRMIASKISVKTVTIIGGIVFLLFAVSALIIGP